MDVLEEYRPAADYTSYIHKMLMQCFYDYRKATITGNARDLKVFIESVRGLYTLLPASIRAEVDKLARRKAKQEIRCLEDLLEYSEHVCASGTYLVAPELEAELAQKLDGDPWNEDKAVCEAGEKSWDLLLTQARTALAIIVEVLGTKGLLIRVARTPFGGEAW